MKKAILDTYGELKPAGYAELIRRFGLKVLPHYCVSYITRKGSRRTIVEESQIVEIYRIERAPGDGLWEQLEFALKREGVNLEILAALFREVEPEEVGQLVQSKPTGKYARQIWFLYEFLTGHQLDVEDLSQGNYVDLLDEKAYYAADKRRSKRHRINNNLWGDRRFCPLIRRTRRLRGFEEAALNERCVEMLKRYPEDVLKRALNYLYTKETKSSFEIEKVTPDQKRVTRFVALLKDADRRDFFNKSSLLELQRSIVDERFANRDFRDGQVYVGQTAGYAREIVHFVPPKPEDIANLMDGMFFAFKRMMSEDLHPIIIAAATAFGFVFMHPFDDGNGRIHRFLIHNILAETGFTPKGLIFPVSATMLKQLGKYDETLELFSQPLQPLVDYTLDEDGRMEVTNETALHYRYIDMTTIAERLFEFIEDTIRSELPEELDFIARYDEAKAAIQEIVDMPDRLIDLFIKVCLQNNGRLSRKKREKAFAKLTAEEVSAMEACLRRVFGDKSAGIVR